MIRKNLFLLITKHEGNTEFYLSNYIPGCLDWDEYINKISNIVNTNCPKNIIHNLTSLRLNSKIIFDKIHSFAFNPSKLIDKLDIVDNLYIINTTDDYINISCSSTFYIDKYYRENGFMSCPETISCFYLVPSKGNFIEYEIKSINYKEGLCV